MISDFAFLKLDYTYPIQVHPLLLKFPFLLETVIIKMFHKYPVAVLPKES